MFQGYQLDKQYTLVKNPNWIAATDPNRKQLAGKMVFNLNINADRIDGNLIHNFAQMDQSGFGVQAASRAQILSSPSLKKNADNRLNGFPYFIYINTKVKPLDNVHCRAVEYAADEVAYQTAYGGPAVGGDIASTVMPPSLIGYKRFDLYSALSRPHGDVAKAWPRPSRNWPPAASRMASAPMWRTAPTTQRRRPRQPRNSRRYRGPGSS